MAGTQTTAFPMATESRLAPLHPEHATILIFGASGDLTARKLLPALYQLWKEGFLSDDAPIVGVARRDVSDEQFRSDMRKGVAKQSRSGPVTDADWAKFSARLFYRRLDISEPENYVAFRAQIEELEQRQKVSGKRVVYLATTPDLFIPATTGLGHAGMIPDANSKETLRVVFEKPFGHDLKSSQELTNRLGRMLAEEQIYRIDHYLGKETVQNILLFRFGNSIFEPLFNRTHIDHVQITVAEDQGIEGNRGAFYDASGALRDVLQNHVLQLLCLVAMEPPALFDAKYIRDEKLKVLQSLAPGRPGDVADWVVAGQFTESMVDGKPAKGYRQEDRIAPDSNRETFVAMECRIDNWRWAGVPFYLRTGKRLPERISEIAIQFKHPPLNLFSTVECEGDICALVEARPNTLIFRIQPKEAISLKISTKRVGMQYQILPVSMDFEYESAFAHGLPEAYERLLLDVLRGDSTLFTRSDELEAAWRFLTPVLQTWEREKREPKPYPAGTWGPAASEELLVRSGRKWRTPSAKGRK